MYLAVLGMISGAAAINAGQAAEIKQVLAARLASMSDSQVASIAALATGKEGSVSVTNECHATGGLSIGGSGGCSCDNGKVTGDGCDACTGCDTCNFDCPINI